ncbi:MAG: septal ring lytic transglycosylase RlpA family protein [Candidatus Kapaibacterium sp.]
MIRLLTKLLSILCTVIIVPAMVGQTPAISDTTAQALKLVRRTIERDRRASDSLRAIWDRQWRVSDSLRVESMLVRMRSDSFRRAVAESERRELLLLQSLMSADTAGSAVVEKAATEIVVTTSADTTLVEKALRASRSTKVASGRTVSDSVTAMVLRAHADTGLASFYGEAFHGRKTASGEIFNMRHRTCAHRWLPFNTKLLVTNLTNGRTVVVRVTDRGPWKNARIVDLSKQAAIDLEMIRSGVTRVSIQVVESDTNDAGEADADD